MPKKREVPIGRTLLALDKDARSRGASRGDSRTGGRLFRGPRSPPSICTSPSVTRTELLERTVGRFFLTQPS